MKVHVEIVAVNPTVHLVYSKDVTLDRVGQTINVESFDLSREGRIALAEPPLELVTAKAHRTAGYPSTFFSTFVLTFGFMLASMAVMASWLFRSSSAPLYAKVGLSVLVVAAAWR